jgi:hypothetical protein
MGGERPRGLRASGSRTSTARWRSPATGTAREAGEVGEPRIGEAKSMLSDRLRRIRLLGISDLEIAVEFGVCSSAGGSTLSRGI